MNREQSILALLYDKAENLSITSFRLWKLKSLIKISEILSCTIVYIILLAGFIFFVLFLNIGLAFWISDFFDKIYTGFIIIAFSNLLLAIIISYIFKNAIQMKLKNHLVFSQYGKADKDYESKNLALTQTIMDFRIKQKEEMLLLKEQLMVIEENIQPINVLKYSIAQFTEALNIKTKLMDLIIIGISLILASSRKKKK